MVEILCVLGLLCVRYVKNCLFSRKSAIIIQLSIFEYLVALIITLVFIESGCFL